MNAIRALLERRCSTDRRGPAVTAEYEQAIQLIREAKYTGVSVTHWAEGVPRRIEFPNPVGIQLSRG